MTYLASNLGEDETLSRDFSRFFGQCGKRRVQFILLWTSSISPAQAMMLQNLGASFVIDFQAWSQLCFPEAGIVLEIRVDDQISAAQTEAFEDFLQALDSLGICSNLGFVNNFFGIFNCEFYLLVILRLLWFRLKKLFVDKHDIL